jgi:hypothetical protein
MIANTKHIHLDEASAGHVNKMRVKLFENANKPIAANYDRDDHK